MLDVIDKGSSHESNPAPLLFAHGAEHAACAGTNIAWTTLPTGVTAPSP
jgi:hypothetical protein